MSIQIKLKNSVVQDSTPSASDLPEVGELAVNGNINSIGGFMRASDNTIVKIFGPGSVTTPTATTTVSGISELATNTETTTGTATNRVVTPAGLNAVTVAERTTSNSTYLALAGGTLTGVVAATAGSNSAPAINFGDSDSGIFGGTNTVGLAAGGTTGLSLDSQAVVEVPTKLAVNGASKVSLVNVRGMTNGNLHIRPITDISSGTGVGLDVLNDASNTVQDLALRGATTIFRNASSESARLDSSGRLLIGHSSSVAASGNGFSLQNNGTGFADSSGLFGRYGADNNGPTFAFSKSRNATLGGQTIVQDDDELGKIRFYGSDGVDFNNFAAEIQAQVDGTPGADVMPGRLVFKTTADDAASPTPRLTIDSSGRVLINTTNNSNVHISASNLAVQGADLSIFKDSGGDNSGVSGHKLKFITQSGSLGEIDVLSEGGGGPNGRGGVMRFYTKANNMGSASENMCIDSSGNVGIGTSSPTNKLTLFGTGAGEATLQIEGEGGADPYINFLANNTQHWSAGIDDSDNDSFKIAKHSALGTNDYFVVTTAGNVGIGLTSSPVSSNSEQGVFLAGADTTQSVIASNVTPLVINRVGTGGNDRNCLELRNNGTLRGNIGAIGAANGMYFETGTSEAMRIDSSGRVGIGTSSPSTPLHVSTNTDGTSDLLTLHADADGQNANNGIASIKFMGNSNHAAFIKGGHTANGDTILTFHTDAHDSGINPEERMRIESDGNVRITSQHLRFDTTNRGIIFGIEGGSDRPSIVGNYTSSTNNNIAFNTTGSERMRIDSSGTVLLSGSRHGNSINDATLRFNIVNSSGDEKKAQIISTKVADISSTIEFGTTVSHAYAERMRIHSDGNVGIGTTSPSSKLEVSGAIFANGGTLQASLQGDITNQLNPALVLTSSSNTSMRANFLLQDDFPSGRGSLAINTTESGVTNDRDLLLQRSGGRVAVGGGEPAVGLHYFGSEFRHENSSIPFIRLKSTNAQGSNHGDYGRLINDVAGTVTGLLDWKRQSATDDSYFTIFTKSNSNNNQERLRITSRGTLCVHANQQTNLNNMNVDSVSMPKYFENTGAQDSSLVGADIHFQTIIRGTHGSSDTLFTFQGGGNCGFFCEVTAYFSSAISDFQGRQRMWWRALRTGNQNFSLTQAHNYDKVGTATNVYFNPLWTSSGSGANEVLGVKVNSVNMGSYVRFWFVARIIAHDNINSMTINR